MMNDVEPGHIP
jgi:hypothetical protein